MELEDSEVIWTGTGSRLEQEEDRHESEYTTKVHLMRLSCVHAVHICERYAPASGLPRWSPSERLFGTLWSGARGAALTVRTTPRLHMPKEQFGLCGNIVF